MEDPYPLYLSEAFLLFTDDAMKRIVSQIPPLDSAPNYMFRSQLINEGMVYKGDCFFLLH